MTAPLVKMAVLNIAPDVLKQLLQLPASVEIDAIRITTDMRGAVQLQVRGAGWDTREGEYIRHAQNAVLSMTTPGAAPRVNWGLPA